MGAYLSQPVVTKERFEGAGQGLVYGGGAMQGWRRTMEDAHIAQVGLAGDAGCAIFGVFDGHGGAEVAKFCQKYMATEIQQLKQFGDDVLEEALVEVFHRMDEMLRDHAYAEELETLKAKEREDDEEAREEEGAAPMDALEMLKRVFQLKRFMGENGAPPGAGEAGAPSGDAAGASAAAAGAVAMDTAAGDDAPAEGAAGGSGAAAAAAQPASAPGAPGAAAGAGGVPPLGGRLQDPADVRIQAGCTAVVAVKKGSVLYVANAGDSRGVLCRKGLAVALSEDHKPAQDNERTRILNAGGFLSDIGGVCRVNGNLNLSRAIGDLKYKTNRGLAAKDQIITAQPDVQRITLTPDDTFFLLACDGVWDVMTNQEAVDFIVAKLKEGAKPSEAVCALLDECLADDPKEARGVGCDNMTAILVELQHPLT